MTGAVQTGDDPASSSSGFWISIAFWLSLLIAAGLFAACVLSGKYLQVEAKARALAGETARVQALSRDVRKLELHLRALENDPDYLQAVARQKLGTASTDRTPVTPITVAPSDEARTSAGQGLAFTAPVDEPDVPVVIDERLAMLRPGIERIASDRLLRNRLLTVAAALVLFGFAFLQDRARPGMDE